MCELLTIKEQALYKQAIITMLWCIKCPEKGHSAWRRLIFASIELIPEYWGREYSIPEDSFHTNNPNCRYYYRRWCVDVSTAIRWYDEIRKEHVIHFIDEPTKQVHLFPEGDSEQIIVESPAYPYLATTTESPIVASNWGAVRISHITPHKDCEEEGLLELIRDMSIIEWINSRLMFDLNDNIDYLTTVNFIAPNPYYCRASLRLGERDKNGKEIAILSLDNYPKEECLNVICCEKINGEPANFQIYRISNSPINFKLSKIADQVGYAVFTNEYQLIDYSGFNSFLRKINFTIKTTGSKVHYKTNKGKSITVEKNSTDEYIEEGNDDSPEIQLSHKKARLKHSREEKKAAENQFLFGNNEDEAADFVRGLINSAKKTITIIDPYFTNEQVVEYLLSIANRHIKVTLYTSSEGFKTTGLDVAQLGKELENLRKKLKEQRHIDNFEINVMTGSPIFHDRFIIIDEKDVWLSGNSFGTIGKRVSSLIKLHNPVEILERLKSIIFDYDGRIKTLDEWLKCKE